MPAGEEPDAFNTTESTTQVRSPAVPAAAIGAVVLLLMIDWSVAVQPFTGSVTVMV